MFRREDSDRDLRVLSSVEDEASEVLFQFLQEKSGKILTQVGSVGNPGPCSLGNAVGKPLGVSTFDCTEHLVRGVPEVGDDQFDRQVGEFPIVDLQVHSGGVVAGLLCEAEHDPVVIATPVLFREGNLKASVRYDRNFGGRRLLVGRRRG